MLNFQWVKGAHITKYITELGFLQCRIYTAKKIFENMNILLRNLPSIVCVSCRKSIMYIQTEEKKNKIS